jgi:hypothetical protein
MSFAQRPRLALESLDQRIVPAVLNLTTAGSEATAPSGAIVSQYDTPTSDVIHPFVRLQSSPLLGGLLGGLLGTGSEQGYNTNARPLQYDESSDPQLTRALTLGEVPVVHVGGIAYREFLLSINQSSSSPQLSLDEACVYVGDSGNLSGYNASTKRLAGRAAAFDLDAGGDVSVRLNANLNAGSPSPDAVMLIPDAAFAGIDANSFVYLYSKFGGQFGAGANGGFEEWGVREVPQPPPPPPPSAVNASLEGAVFADGNRDGVRNEWESGLAGVLICLQGVDYLGNAVSMEVVTGDDGTFLFNDISVGTYTLSQDPPFGYASGSATAGTEGGAAEPGQITDITIEEGDAATGYLFGDMYNE